MPNCIGEVKLTVPVCYVGRMSKQRIKQIIENKISDEPIAETGLQGVQFFRVTDPVRCAPAVYEPSVIAIVNGSKEAILDGKTYDYDSSKYMCCTMPMPVEAGTPKSSRDNPLLGVIVSLDTRVMTELALEMKSVANTYRKCKVDPAPSGLALARWDGEFTEALLRLLQIAENPADVAALGNARLREFYYAVFKGDAGESVSHAFGVGNEIARAIKYLSSHLEESVTIEDIAAQVGMSRAVFHRRFKQATTMSPLQFVKSMRLNTAAMKIAAGMNVNEAAAGVGYLSSSQFSREFKRMYGQSPRQWSNSKKEPVDVVDTHIDSR